MTGPTARTWVRRALIAGLAATGLVLSWAWDQRSVERGNRLFRSGAMGEAAALYGQRMGGDEAAPELRYNFGTSLLELGSEAADAEFEAAREDGPTEVQARSYYNSGLSSLRQALEGAEGDSLRALAEGAVRANREALLRRPDHVDTKWNLALAQRLLDSIQAADQRAGREQAEGALEAEEVQQSDNVLELDEEQELPEDAPMDGEEEARADTSQEDGMSQLEADEILTTTHLDPSEIVRKLLSLESRSYWGRRTRRAPVPRR